MGRRMPAAYQSHAGIPQGGQACVRAVPCTNLCQVPYGKALQSLLSTLLITAGKGISCVLEHMSPSRAGLTRNGPKVWDLLLSGGAN